MQAPGPGRAVCPLAAVCLLLTLLLCGAAVDSGESRPGSPPASAEQAHYDRPDADHVRATADDILSDPHFRPRESFEQWLAARLREALGPNWHRSEWTRREIVQGDDTKVHVVTTFVRLREDGSEIAAYDSLYVLTFEDGRWAIKGRSSFAP